MPSTKIDPASKLHDPSGKGTDQTYSLGISKAYEDLKDSLKGLTGKAHETAQAEAQKVLDAAANLKKETKAAIKDGVLSSGEKSAVEAKQTALHDVATEAKTHLDSLKADITDAATNAKINAIENKITTFAQEAVDKTSHTMGSVLDKTGLIAVCVAGGAGLMATLFGAGAAISFLAKKAKSGRDLAKSNFANGFQSYKAASTSDQRQKVKKATPVKSSPVTIHAATKTAA